MAIKTVNMSTHDLKSGDVVMCHGCLFKLTEREEYPTDADLIQYGPIVVFKTELLVYESRGNMPYHWATDWRIQGNKLAHWAKVVE